MKAYNVLVVDDSAVMRSMIVRILRLSGVPVGTVCQAGSGEDALTQLQSTWIDLVMVDLNMPGMDGEELVDRIRTSPAFARLPVLVVSTESSETRIERLRAKGAEFVHKPFTPERLRESIVKLLGEPSDE